MAAWKHGKHKYKAKPVNCPVDGYFASTKEYTDWQKLKMLQQSGVISHLERQVKFQLNGPAGIKVCDYVADATFMEDGKSVCYDTKGVKTDVYKLKKKLFAQQYPEWEHRES